MQMESDAMSGADAVVVVVAVVEKIDSIMGVPFWCYRMNVGVALAKGVGRRTTDVGGHELALVGGMARRLGHGEPNR